MPQVLINSQPCNIDTSNYRTVKEIIPALKENFLDQEHKFATIQVDDIVYTTSSQIGEIKTQLDQVEVINIVTSKKLSAIQESISFLPSFLDKLINDIKDCSSRYEEHGQASSKQYLGIIVEKIDLFIQLVTSIHQYSHMNSNQKLQTGMTIKELEVHLLSVVKGIHLAQKKEDIIMLVDLLDHELVDNLTQWKISAIPQIKRVNSI